MGNFTATRCPRTQRRAESVYAQEAASCTARHTTSTRHTDASRMSHRLAPLMVPPSRLGWPCESVARRRRTATSKRHRLRTHNATTPETSGSCGGTTQTHTHHTATHSHIPAAGNWPMVIAITGGDADARRLRLNNLLLGTPSQAAELPSKSRPVRPRWPPSLARRRDPAATSGRHPRPSHPARS